MPRPSTTLSVNVNKIALLRNARPGEVPSLLDLSRLALEAGAAGITVHPRPDERHIRIADVDRLAEMLAEDWPGREFNIEGNPLDAGGGHLMPIMRRVRPTQATLVPDAPGQSTSDHGFALTDPAVVDELRPIVEELRSLGCRVSLFVDPDPEAAAAAAETGTDRIELYTESYASAFGGPDHQPTLDRFAAAARAATDAGLEVNAGHDLNLDNLRPFVEAVPGVREVSIGHAFVADSLQYGMADTVRRYLACLG